MGSLFSPDEPDLPDDDHENAKERADEARRRRGLAGTIRTSGRGVLTPLGGGASRKTLLGE
jgi:hypothetical protein